MELNQDNEFFMMLNSSESSENESVSSLDFFTDLSTTDSSQSEGEEHITVQNFLQTIELYSDSDFKKHFRLSRNTAGFIIERYGNSNCYVQRRPGGRPKISADKEIYLFIWYMGNTNTFREIANLFGISKASSWRIVERVSAWLISIGHEYIKWPTYQELQSNIAHFRRTKKIPGIVGCIDSSHIKIKAPLENKECYFNRKRYYSLHLQAVVNANKQFIDVYAGEPGSLHDSRVLRRSSFYQRALQNQEQLFPNNSFIVGDSAYPSLSWLIPPFKDNGNLTPEQIEFNTLHSSARICVENAFGLLKTWFRRLMHFTEQVHLNMTTNLIICGCILHNICLLENDEFDLEVLNSDEVVQEIDPSQEFQQSQQVDRRQQLLNELLLNNIIRT